jgi:CBS domain-containing protein
MTTGTLCNRDVVVALKSERIVDAARRMRTQHVGDLVVVETTPGGPVPIGMVTDRDIVVEVVAGAPDHIDYLLVGDVMTEDVVTAREDVPVAAALKTMEVHGVRRLPIVDAQGVLTGILTLDDVLPHLTVESRQDALGIVAAEQRRERMSRP